MRYILKFFVCLIFYLVGTTSLLNANNPQNKFQAIIFDCDGVLVDTEYLKFLAWQDALKVYDISFSIDEYMPLVGHSSKKILQMIKDVKKIDIPKEVIEIKNDRYKIIQKKGVLPIKEMVSFAFRLFRSKDQLDVKLALASSAPKEEILNNLKQIGLENIFDLIISGSDDLSDYIDIDGTNKPKPYIYIEAAKRLGVCPEFCLVFEDTKAGVDAASSAGMTSVAVPNRFTLNHDFSNACRIISSYDYFNSMEILSIHTQN